MKLFPNCYENTLNDYYLFSYIFILLIELSSLPTKCYILIKQIWQILLSIVTIFIYIIIIIIILIIFIINTNKTVIIVFTIYISIFILLLK